MLKIEDLRENEYYYEEYNDGRQKYISKCGKGNKTQYYVSLHFDEFKEGGETGNHVQNLRFATPQEEAHLNACIKANRYIPLSEIKENQLNSVEIW